MELRLRAWIIHRKSNNFSHLRLKTFRASSVDFAEVCIVLAAMFVFWTMHFSDWSVMPIGTWGERTNSRTLVFVRNWKSVYVFKWPTGRATNANTLEKNNSGQHTPVCHLTRNMEDIHTHWTRRVTWRCLRGDLAAYHWLKLGISTFFLILNVVHDAVNSTILFPVPMLCY